MKAILSFLLIFLSHIVIADKLPFANFAFTHLQEDPAKDDYRNAYIGATRCIASITIAVDKQLITEELAKDVDESIRGLRSAAALRDLTANPEATPLNMLDVLATINNDIQENLSTYKKWLEREGNWEQVTKVSWKGPFGIEVKKCMQYGTSIARSFQTVKKNNSE